LQYTSKYLVLEDKIDKRKTPSKMLGVGYIPSKGRGWLQYISLLYPKNKALRPIESWLVISKQLQADALYLVVSWEINP